MRSQPACQGILPGADLHRSKLANIGLMKMKHFIPACAAILLAACSPAGSKSEALAGTWMCQSATVDGHALLEAKVRLMRLTLTRDRFKTERGS